MKKDVLFVVVVIAVALLCVLGLTVFMGQGGGKEEPIPAVEQTEGDPGQTIPREEMVDDPLEVEPADGEFVDVTEELEQVAQDAESATQNSLLENWDTLLGAGSSYDKVKAYDALLVGFRNMLMQGEEPQLVEKFHLGDTGSSGFRKVTLDVGEQTLDFYGIVLPQTATLSSSRASILVVLRDQDGPVYSEYLAKKSTRALEDAVFLGDREVAVFGPVLDSRYGTSEQLWFATGVATGQAAIDYLPASVQNGYGTLVTSESDGTILVKSGVDGVSVAPGLEGGLRFVCSDGSEQLNVVCEDGKLTGEIGEAGSQPSAGTGNPLDEVEIPTFD